MRRKFLILGLLYVALVSLAAGIYAEAAGRAREYEGVITQMNLGDGSFVMRLRDGSLVTVKNPFAVEAFVKVKGVLENGVVSEVSELKLKDPNGPDAPPKLTAISPGSGTVGTKVVVSGRGLLPTQNTISIGGVQNALVNLPSKRGEISFVLPSSPCDQKNRSGCVRKMLQPGVYDIAITNKNGLSNAMSFQVLPLPQLGVRTESLPQVTAGDRYRAYIEALGGADNYDWQISGGALPPGLKLNQSPCYELPCRTSGMITGIPQVPGTYNFTVRPSSGDESVTREYRLVVVQAVSSY